MDRPYLVIFGSASVDGRLTIAPDVLLLHGDERWNAVAGGGEAMYEWLKSTHKPQAFLEGSLSFARSGDPISPLPPFEGDPASLYEDFLPDAIINRPGHRGWFTAVDSQGRIRWDYKEFPTEEWAGWYAMVLVARQTPPEYLAYLRREDIPYLVAGEARVDLRQGVEKMRLLLGVERVVSTSPGKLGGALVRAGLVDEINLNFFPALIGGTHTPVLFEAPDLLPEELPVRLKLLLAQVLANGHVWLRYAVEKES